MEKACLNGPFLCCTWRPQNNKESAGKRVGEGKGSNREMRSYKVGGSGKPKTSIAYFTILPGVS